MKPLLRELAGAAGLPPRALLPARRTAGSRPIPVFWRLAAALALALVVGCRSAAPPPRAPGAPADRAAPGAPAAARVIASARSVLGAPYRYSGADPGGFDCSGLVAYAFASVGLALPRRAAEQARSGRWVALDELAAGDLVFFSTEEKPNHVGLVVSAAGEPLRMIHAASSRGVIETDVLGERYWLDRLRFGRRVLP